MYITINELKSEYPQDYSAYTNEALTSLIEKATDKVDDYCEQSFNLETITDEISKAYIDADNSLVVFPRKKPIQTLTSLKIVKGDAEVELTLTDSNGSFSYTIPTTKDRIILPVDDITLNSVDLLDFSTLRNVDFYSKITYTAGYSTIPNIIKEATALFTLDSIARRSNLSGATSINQGGISITYGNGRSDLVKDAERLLKGYKKVGGF